MREEELVCYADKRVLHTQVVNLSARKLDHIKRVYQVHNREAVKVHAMEVVQRFEQYQQLEAKICRFLQTPLERVIPDNTIGVTFKYFIQVTYYRNTGSDGSMKVAKFLLQEISQNGHQYQLLTTKCDFLYLQFAFFIVLVFN